MVSEDEVQKLAQLARLSVSPEEAKSLTEDLNAILGYVQQLEEVSVSSVAAMSHVHGFTNVLREDKVSQEVGQEELLAGVPDRSGNSIRVPLIIDQTE